MNKQLYYIRVYTHGKTKGEGIPSIWAGHINQKGVTFRADINSWFCAYMPICMAKRALREINARQFYQKQIQSGDWEYRIHPMDDIAERWLKMWGGEGQYIRKDWRGGW